MWVEMLQPLAGTFQPSQDCCKLAIIIAIAVSGEF